jgi:hypothetical protein
MMRVYRIQDAEGRGPFRPGFSHIWADEHFGPGVEAMPTWQEEFGTDLLDRRGLPGEWFGSAVRSIKDLSRWFSDAEQERLRGLGFRVVSIGPVRILAESKNQVVFASRLPLAVAARGGDVPRMSQTRPTFPAP